MATKTSSSRGGTQDAIDAGAGILRLQPCWVPRTFMIPGRRLRLHPDDLYALGAHRGGINERWFCSTTHASNGPGTPDDEGLSYVRPANGARVLFKSLVDEGGDLLLGSSTMQREGGWNRARRERMCGAVSRTGARETTASCFCLVPIRCNPARDGRSIRAFFTHLAHSSRMSHRSTAMSSRCFSLSSMGASSIALF